MAFGLTPSGVSSTHMPGEEWTLGPGQGCAPGYTEQELPNGNWTCISAADFAQVQQGNFTSLVPIGAAPSGPVTFTPPGGGAPVAWSPPATPQSPTAPVAPTPPPPSTPPVMDRVPSTAPLSQQFAASNIDVAATPVSSPSGAPSSDVTSPVPLASASVSVSPLVLALAALGAYVLMRKRT